jgi:hypothetical protein
LERCFAKAEIEVNVEHQRKAMMIGRRNNEMRRAGIAKEQAKSRTDDVKPNSD